MSKKVTIILSVVLAVVLLTVGVASVVIAQTPPPTQPEGKSLLARVAEILGGNITEQKLIDAFKQANIESRSQAIEKALENAVKNNRINQAQSDQIKQWWQQRPPALDSLLGGFFGMPGWHMRGVQPDGKSLLARVAEILGGTVTEQKLIDAFKQASQEMRTEAFNRALDNAVKNGRLTLDQAEKIREKIGDKPGAINWFWGRMHNGFRGPMHRGW